MLRHGLVEPDFLIQPVDQPLPVAFRLCEFGVYIVDEIPLLIYRERDMLEFAGTGKGHYSSFFSTTLSRRSCSFTARLIFPPQ